MQLGRQDVESMGRRVDRVRDWESLVRKLGPAAPALRLGLRQAQRQGWAHSDGGRCLGPRSVPAVHSFRRQRYADCLLMLKWAALSAIVWLL